jgi:hypothetical protein
MNIFREVDNCYIDELAGHCQKYREIEEKAREYRKELEQKIIETMDITDDFLGTRHGGNDYDVTISKSEKYDVDAEHLQKLASENNLEYAMFHISRWKAELNVNKFKNLDDDKKSILSKAITVTKTNPTIKIKLKTINQ